MSNSSIEEKRSIAKEFLLTSPPGQFQKTLTDLNSILNCDNSIPSVLSREFVNEVESIYNDRTGRTSILKQSKGICDDDEVDGDEFGKSLKESFQKYVDSHYKGKGVESNYCIHKQRNHDVLYEIFVYAERIKLKQFHAGSWFAKYSIVRDASKNAFSISGEVVIHAHSFENGNVHVKSNVTLPSKSISHSSTEVIATIQKWDEEHVLRPLKRVYDDLSSNLLKTMRRVMPVTRTKFDWNFNGHTFVRAMEKNMQNKHN